MTSTNNITRKKMDGVTILRFIAAFYVFIFHINMRVPVNFGELINKTISNGVIGMSIFFMLSGFVLTYNYYGSLSNNYFRKRIARIFPAYLFCGLLTLPFLLSSDASFLKMIASIFLFVTGMQSWIYQTFDFWNFSGTWSISVELFFYALFPFLIKNINKNNVIYVLLFSYLSSALLIPLSDIIQGPVVWSVYYATPIYRLPEFVVGVCIAILFLYGYRVNHYTWLLSILLFLYATTQQNNNSMGVNYLTIPAISIMLLHLAKINIKNNIANRAIIYFGDISYSFYLMQLPILYYLDHNKNSFILNYGLFSWLVLFVINTAMASLSYHFLEKNDKIRKIITS